MADQARREEAAQNQDGQNRKSQNPESRPQVVDAVRHVGPTLEQDERYLAVESNVLPENVIADEGLTETVNVRAVAADRYDREAEAMGAEPLRTRLPGDSSSDPHTDVGPDNATNLDDDRTQPDRNKSNRNEAA